MKRAKNHIELSFFYQTVRREDKKFDSISIEMKRKSHNSYTERPSLTNKAIRTKVFTGLKKVQAILAFLSLKR